MAVHITYLISHSSVLNCHTVIMSNHAPPPPPPRGRHIVFGSVAVLEPCIDSIKVSEKSRKLVTLTLIFKVKLA